MHHERLGRAYIGRVALLLALGCGACGDARDMPTRSAAGAPSRQMSELDLVDHSGWRAYDGALDPLIEHQPRSIACGIAGWYVENEALEIDTGRCNYALLEHPALREVTRGLPLELELRHFDLRSDDAAQAHVAVLFGDRVQWEAQVPIPSGAQVMRATFDATRSLAAGEPIRFHLHNHGQNSWMLVSLRAR